MELKSNWLQCRFRTRGDFFRALDAKLHPAMPGCTYSLFRDSPFDFHQLHLDDFDFTRVHENKVRKENFLIWRNRGIPLWFLEEHREQIDWEILSKNPSVPLEFLAQNRDKVNWEQVVKWARKKDLEKYGVYWTPLSGIFIGVCGFMVTLFTFFACMHFLILVHRPIDILWVLLFLAAVIFVLLEYGSRRIRTIHFLLFSLMKELKRFDAICFVFDVYDLIEIEDSTFEQCMGDRTEQKWLIECLKENTDVGEQMKILVKKFLRVYPWQKFFTHPFFQNEAFDSIDWEFLFELPLPLEFYSEFYQNAPELHRLVKNPLLDEAFWEENYKKLNPTALQDFLRFYPNLTVEFLFCHLPELLKIVPKFSLIEAVAENYFTLQKAYEKFEPIAQRAKRNFLHRYYCPSTELGNQRLLREYEQMKNYCEI